MYECMQVTVFVCMHVFMYASIYACVYAWACAGMHACIIYILRRQYFVQQQICLFLLLGQLLGSFSDNLLEFVRVTFYRFNDRVENVDSKENIRDSYHSGALTMIMIMITTQTKTTTISYSPPAILTSIALTFRNVGRSSASSSQQRRMSFNIFFDISTSWGNGGRKGVSSPLLTRFITSVVKKEWPSTSRL